MTSSQTPTNRGLETCWRNHLHTGENVLCHDMTHMHGIIKDEAGGEITCVWAEITYTRENMLFRKHRETRGFDLPPSPRRLENVQRNQRPASQDRRHTPTRNHLHTSANPAPVGGSDCPAPASPPDRARLDALRSPPAREHARSPISANPEK